jgi:hypothetical protein
MKVAYELSDSGRAAALSGVYGEQADRIFAKLFKLEGFLWPEFFFGMIVRIQGEGILAGLLGPGGSLQGYMWCQEFAQGIPSSVQESENTLAEAERELSDAEREEQRKSQQFQLCPHCRAPFMVDQRNCGAFVCGRDAHGGIGGAQVHGVYGCNQQFNVDQAAQYLPDVTILEPLHRRRDDLQSQMRVHQGGAFLWERATSFPLPILDVVSSRDMAGESFADAISANLADRAPTSRCAAIVQQLKKGESFLRQLRLLPGLVQVRVHL